MGMDLVGRKPISTHGEYFRSSCWQWGPLWKLLCDTCGSILTEEDKKNGQYNIGHLITDPKAKQIGAKIWSMLRSGEVAAYAAATPPVLDEGTAAFMRLTEEALGRRLGTGTVIVSQGGKPTVHLRDAKPEPLDLHFVAEFADFCLQSGGFEIW